MVHDKLEWTATMPEARMFQRGQLIRPGNERQVPAKRPLVLAIMVERRPAHSNPHWAPAASTLKAPHMAR